MSGNYAVKTVVVVAAAVATAAYPTGFRLTGDLLAVIADLALDSPYCLYL